MAETERPAFEFITGAYNPRMYGPLAAWVRYRPGPAEVSVVARGPRWVHLRCPDRELLIVRNAVHVHSPRPLDSDWDEFVPFGLCSTGTRNLPLPRLMMNYMEHSQLDSAGVPRAVARKSANLRLPGSVVRDGRNLTSDSGGFQFLSGRIDWIDPLDLAAWYTNNVDMGITLDVPIPPPQENEFLLRAARVQRANYALLRENLPPNFKLLNVVHGSNLERSRKFRAILERDPTSDAVCLGGVYFGDNVYSLARLCGHLLDPNARTYAHYHVLGIYNVAMTAPIIRLAALLRARGHKFTISTDASTAVYSANNRTMHLQRAHWKNVERVMLGRSTPVGTVPNPYRLLPCGCPVCSTLKYTDVLSHIDDATIAHTFILHNALEIERWMEQTLHYATVLDAAQFLELMTAQFKNDRRLFTLKISLQFVESVAANGFEAASKEFAQYLGGMFGASVVEAPPEAGLFDRVIPEEPTAGWFKGRLTNILGHYENYHRGRTVEHVKRKASERVRQTSKVLANQSVARAGKLKQRRAVVKVSAGSSHARTPAKGQASPGKTT